MIYKLIIAGDEELIRNGLKDLTPWNDYGFSVEGVFADCKDVI
jgi:YesN/AraC family two-component response regulator